MANSLPNTFENFGSGERWLKIFDGNGDGGAFASADGSSDVTNWFSIPEGHDLEAFVDYTKGPETSVQIAGIQCSHPEDAGVAEASRRDTLILPPGTGVVTPVTSALSATGFQTRSVNTGSGAAGKGRVYGDFCRMQIVVTGTPDATSALKVWIRATPPG